MMTTERKLATVEQITALTSIPDADAIEVASVRGWKVVVRRGEFAVGDLVAYFEIDTMLPVAEGSPFAFLAPRGTKTVDGADFHVLKTIKLRGQVSQGLVVPLSAITTEALEPGTDLTEALGLSKWEPPIPAELSGMATGAFPTNLLPKTDAERVQNLGSHWPLIQSHRWVATEKVDGSSITLLNTDGSVRICSRNWELQPSDNLSGLRAATAQGVLPDVGWAVQGEVFGEGIQNNPLRIKGVRFAVFNVLRMVDGRFVPVGRSEWPERFARHAVPLVDLPLPKTIEEAVRQVDGMRSLISPDRLAEGVVWHVADGTPLSALGGRECWKAINNAFLLKNG